MCRALNQEAMDGTGTDRLARHGRHCRVGIASTAKVESSRTSARL
ncbi:hypothetical protein SAMCFNEI73_pB0303 (plasmid) [Sinorhizobium americanum]|uniref:Uncharacterized protein n=1 Tax=Sinorhizobium americanum TaxID=194963 RepID=A0A1L3LTV7_9HYPH|nr:hypothetical protein SAMCFNEI73_pB0303 [Sinorhizobium americanum]